MASTAVMFWQTWLFHTFRGRAHANVGKFQFTEPFPGMQKVTTTQPLDAKKVSDWGSIKAEILSNLWNCSARIIYIHLLYEDCRHTSLV